MRVLPPVQVDQTCFCDESLAILRTKWRPAIVERLDVRQTNGEFHEKNSLKTNEFRRFSNLFLFVCNRQFEPIE